VRSGVTAPLGFRAAATSAGLKAQGDDLALLVGDTGCTVAAVFTTNRAQAAPVRVSREHVASGRARAVVVNAGCANAATGSPGLADAREMAALTGRALGCEPNDVVVASTGVIGTRLPLPAIGAGIARAAASLSPEGGAAAARAILTTDTHPKECVVEFSVDGRTARVGAMAKGAGMIAPNLATLLAFFTTDAAVEAGILREALVRAVGGSLNRISVDGDTSTNDMAVVLASGALPGAAITERGPGAEAFASALAEAAQRIARMIVRDGEGATRAAEILVLGAGSEGDALRIARTVAESPLVKTALHGGDPNWGRILAAAGRAGVAIDVDKMDILLGDVWVAGGGAARDYDEDAARRAILEDPARVTIRLSEGTSRASVWTCDLSHGYVDINAHYRS
jgi:glutamate N-acetyltransferase/amino-acid N-acetyltransferase